LVWPSVLSLNNLKIYKTKAAKNFCPQEKFILRLTFNPGLALTGFRTSRPRLQQDPIENQHLVSDQLKKTRERGNVVILLATPSHCTLMLNIAQWLSQSNYSVCFSSD